jgi:flagellar hook-basal body complex protein FliE
MKVIFLAKEKPHLLGWMEVEEGEEFSCPECLARLKVVDGKLVRIIEGYDEPCPHASLSEKDGTFVVYFTRYLEEDELAKQSESEYVNIRELGLTPTQLGKILGLLNWIKKTFPKVLEELQEAEKLAEQMSSGDPKVDAKVRVAVWDARVKVKTLLESLEEYSSELM